MPSEQKLLTGTVLEWAVVRKMYQGAFTEHSPIYGWRVFSKPVTHPYSTARIDVNCQNAIESEAIHAAALKVLKDAGYTFPLDTSFRSGWQWKYKDEGLKGFTSLDLAQQSAMSHYVGQSEHPAH